MCVQARVNDQVVGYRDLAALPRDKAILQVERPDLMTYQPHLSFSPLDPPRREVPYIHRHHHLCAGVLIANQPQRRPDHLVRLSVLKTMKDFEHRLCFFASPQRSLSPPSTSPPRSPEVRFGVIPSVAFASTTSICELILHANTGDGSVP